MKLYLLKYYIKKKISIILFFFFKLLNFKKDFKKIIFISYPDLSDNSWYLFKYINNAKKNLNLIWLVDDIVNINQKKLSTINLKKNRIQIIKRLSIKGIYHYLSSNLVFSTHGAYFFSKKNIGPTNINLWHGMPLKQIGYLNKKSRIIVPYADYYVSTSKLYSKILMKAFKIKKNQVLNVGLPRNDVLINNSNLNKENLKKIKQIKKNNKKIIIWLPTFRLSNKGEPSNDSTINNFLKEWPENFLVKLNDIAKKFKILLIIKLHPLDIINKKKQKNKLSNILIYNVFKWKKNSFDLYDLISQSDALITDISSVIIDYILTNRPLGLTTKSLEFYNRGLIKELNIQKNLNYLKLSNLKDFVSLFLKVKKNSKFKVDPKKLYYFPKNKNSCKDIVNHFDIQ